MHGVGIEQKTSTIRTVAGEQAGLITVGLKMSGEHSLLLIVHIEAYTLLTHPPSLSHTRMSCAHLVIYKPSVPSISTPI